MPSRIIIRHNPVRRPRRLAELGEPLWAEVARIRKANITVSKKYAFAAFVSEFIRTETSPAFRARHLCAAKINLLKLRLLVRTIHLVQGLRTTHEDVLTAA